MSGDFNRFFFQKRHPKSINIFKHTLISNWEMPIKTKMIYHQTVTRMAKIKRLDRTKS